MADWPAVRPVVLHVYESPVPKAGMEVRASYVGNYFAWLLSEGEVLVENQGRSVKGKAGDWVIAHPGPRYQRFSPDARILSIQFQAKWPDGFPLFSEGLSLAFPSAEVPVLEEKARALLEFARGVLPNDPFATVATPLLLREYLAVQHYGLAFLLALFEVFEQRGLVPSRLGQTDERLLAALRRLDGWPLDLALDWEHIARPTGLSGDHLGRLFQEAFAVTPSRYFASRRHDHARRMLAHTATPVKVIAYDLGFGTAADFSAWFRRTQGCSPTDYRKLVVG